MNELLKEVKCPRCENTQEEKYKYCQKCLREMPGLPSEKRQPTKKSLGKVETFFKFHPLLSGSISFLGIILIGSIIFFSYHISFAEEPYSEILRNSMVMFYFGLAAYCAKLRGRSMAWGFLLILGLIVISILPIKEPESNMTFTEQEKKELEYLDNPKIQYLSSPIGAIWSMLFQKYVDPRKKRIIELRTKMRMEEQSLDPSKNWQKYQEIMDEEEDRFDKRFNTKK